jgi:hypothetical protein
MHDWKDYLHPVNGRPFMVEEWRPTNSQGRIIRWRPAPAASIAASETELDRILRRTIRFRDLELAERLAVTVRIDKPELTAFFK